MIIITAESGCDMTKEQAKKLGVFIVPMHVTMDGYSYDDGMFPSEDICTYYEKTGILPKTSGSTQMDYARVFDDIHTRYPDAHILHLAYSAVTTVSYSCAQREVENRDYVTILDTKQVSAGQLAIVLKIVDILKSNPNISVEQLISYAKFVIEHTRMSFVVDCLEYLKAGGRCSNAAYLGGQILKLHPCIEIDNGQLRVTKKYRGSIERIIPHFVNDFTEKNNVKKDKVVLIWSPGLSDKAKTIAEKSVMDCGYQSYEWVKTGCVITTHGGPGCFGMVAMDIDAQGETDV